MKVERIEDSKGFTMGYKVTIGRKSFVLDGRDIVLLDTLGRRDYIPASQFRGKDRRKIKRLYRLGLVDREKIGGRIYYTLSPTGWEILSLEEIEEELIGPPEMSPEYWESELREVTPYGIRDEYGGL